MIETFTLSTPIILGIAAVAFFNAAYNVAVGPTGGAMIAGFSALLPPPLALMLQAFGNIVGSSTRTITFFRHIERKPFIIAMAAMVVGFAVAMPVFRYVPEYILQLGLGVMVLLMTWLPKSKSDGSSSNLGLFGATVLGGVLSLFFSAGMIAVGSYYLRYFPERERYLAHVNVWALIQNIAKITWFSTWLAVDHHTMLILAGVVLVSMMVGHMAGLKIAGRVPETRLRQALKITISIFAIVLLYKGAQHIWPQSG